MQFICSLFWKWFAPISSMLVYTRSILHNSMEFTLCLHIVIISKWDFNLQFGQRSTPFLVITESSIFQIGHSQVDIPISLFILNVCIQFELWICVGLYHIGDYLDSFSNWSHIIHTMLHIVIILNVRMQSLILNYKV